MSSPLANRVYHIRLINLDTRKHPFKEFELALVETGGIMRFAHAVPKCIQQLFTKDREFSEFVLRHIVDTGLQEMVFDVRKYNRDARERVFAELRSEKFLI